MATELIKGKSIHEALALTNKAVAEALDGLPPVKMHCSVLAEQAIKAALVDYAQKNNIDIPELEGFEQTMTMIMTTGRRRRLRKF